MDYVQRLPFILGASMAVIIGIISNSTGTESKTIYIRMSVGLVVFFILGLYMRNTIYRINKEVRKKKEEESRIKEQSLIENITKVEKHSVDYRVDDNSFEMNINTQKEEKLYDEEFTPLSVNSININKDEGE
ncbi:MAG: hypothetical protein GX270_13095 [Clostridiaceae bacterium]|jgi:cell division protein FtsL|nr:hypothetical protein [Clostridiaceae bacterium]